MKRALELALHGWGATSPNPLVGAVVVKNGRIVGRGFHRCAGTPHAEVHALRAAGRRARGADLYVTLEPCCHYGRTPPCVERIIDAGIRRVVIGVKDPNPLVNGRGIRILKRAGVAVTVGVLPEACRDINRPYETYITTGRPFVILKAAVSLDGKIATSSGESRWITGRECRRYVHRLRSGVDAILVGGGTVRKDNPRLTARPGRGRPAERIAVVLDGRLDLPPRSRIFRRKPGRLILAATAAAPKGRIAAARLRGYEVIMCRRNRAGRADIAHLLRELGRRGIASLMVEGGGETFAQFVARGLVDHVVVCVAPKFIGGEGKDALPGFSFGGMRDALHLKDTTARICGDDVVVEGSLAR